MARAGGLKLFDAGGGKSGRGLLVSADGVELSVRLDTDVADSHAHLMSGDWPTVLALVWINPRSKRAALEALWPVGGGGDLDLTDPVLGWIASDSKAKPQRPGRAAAAKKRGGLGMVGALARVRRHVDRTGATMQTWGLVGPRDYVRVLVFASRNSSRDVRRARGDVVAFRAQVLDRGGVCVADAPVKGVVNPGT